MSINAMSSTSSTPSLLQSLNTMLNSGTAVTITVDSTNDTLQGLESAINNDTSTTGL